MTISLIQIYIIEYHDPCFYWLVQFMTISEGLEGGADPPAFQVAERERMVKASAEENSSVSIITAPC